MSGFESRRKSVLYKRLVKVHTATKKISCVDIRGLPRGTLLEKENREDVELFEERSR